LRTGHKYGIKKGINRPTGAVINTTPVALNNIYKFAKHRTAFTMQPYCIRPTYIINYNIIFGYIIGYTIYVSGVWRLVFRKN